MTSSSGVVFLPNVLLSTARGAFNAVSDGTSAPTAYLTGVMAHIERNRASAYTPLSAAALDADYAARVATGTDIAPGDRVTAITLLDGVTPWPSSLTVASNEVWTVVYVRETALPLPLRMVYLARQIGGGLAR